MIGQSLLLGAVGAAPASPLLTGLARYYKLDGDGVDAHGGQDGVVTGAGWVSGKLGQGFDFANSVARSIVASAFNPLGEMSVSFWMRWNPPGGSTYAQVLGQMDGGSGSQNWVILLGGYTLTWYVYGNVAVHNIDMTVASVGWAHVAWTRTATGVLTGYRNGTPVAGPSAPTVIGNIPAANLRFGTRNDLYAGFNGQLDEVGLWTRVLTAADVADLYNSGAGKGYPFNA